MYVRVAVAGWADWGHGAYVWGVGWGVRTRTRRPAPAEARVADMVDTRRAEPDYQRGQHWHSLHLVVFIESLR